MQSYLTRRSSREQRVSGGEFCEVISTLTHDLTKARNQLVRLMHQVSPGGAARLYGGYSVPLRSHTPCAQGSNLRNRHRTPLAAAGQFGCGDAYQESRASVQPRIRPCRPMTVHGAHQFGPPPQQRVPFPCGRKVPKSCEGRPHNKVQYPWERQQQCNRSDTSDRSDTSERSGQRDNSTCVNITFDDDSSEPAAPAAARRPQRCRRDTNTCRSDSKPGCLESDSGCDPTRLQGGGSSRRRHDCVGTQFATLLQDVTYELRVRRLAANLVKKP